ncbi:MAG: RES family NAD+ phosphorylase [Sedimenticola sp.]
MQPPVVEVRWPKSTRLIDTAYPPVDLFGELTDDPDENEAMWALECRTNIRLQYDTWDFGLVRPEDVVTGSDGAAVLMASVMYVGVGHLSRFSDGSFGAYYAGKETETALREYAYQAERYRLDHALKAEVVTARAWIAKTIKPLHDVRGPKFKHLQDPDPASYPTSAALARELRDAGSWGMAYKSTRHKGGECIAIFRPPAITAPKQGGLYDFNFDGSRITEVSERRGPIIQF